MLVRRGGGTPQLLVAAITLPVGVLPFIQSSSQSARHTVICVSDTLSRASQRAASRYVFPPLFLTRQRSRDPSAHPHRDAEICLVMQS